MTKLLLLAVLVAAVVLYFRRAGRSERMSATEAYRLLDLQPGADRDAVVAAHRRLVARVHPDAGGSAELAARVNAARDVLLKQ